MIPRKLEPEVMDTPQEAADYDAMAHSEPNRRFVERLIELGAHGRMLDIGTGPGHIPLMVCETLPEAHVVAIDLAHHMLEIAERHRAASPVGARVEFRIGDAKQLEFADGEFDTVFSNTILHHIRDPRPMLREAWRVLRPGGVLLIRDLFRPKDNVTVERLVDLYAAGMSVSQRGLLRDSLHAAFTPEELRDLVDECGLTGVEVVIDSDRHMSLQRAAAR